MAVMGDREYGAFLEKASTGNQIDTSRSTAKEAEALSVPGITKEYIQSRGGINSQGYYNDVPAYQQLTANERKSVTLANGTINTAAMLAILNQKEAEYKQSKGLKDFSPGISSTDSGYLVATPPSSTMLSGITLENIQPVKTAPIDTILFDDDSLPIEIMSDLIFENIGGQELLNIARTDTINGQKIIYQPIKNLTTIQQKYNPNNILNIDKTSDKHFSGYAIKLEEKIPSVGNGVNGENVYIDSETGDLVIEVINMSRGEQVELEISINGTIYEAEI